MTEFTLGLDLGSRAVKAVLYEPATSRIRAVLVRDGSPDQAADAAGLASDILAAPDISAASLIATMATGYGRVQAAFAGATTTEITCHAVGAAALHPEARSVIDIGGQDSKAIRLDEAGRVLDFAMNDRCAAGCGRFLEVVARILGTDVDGLAGLAGKPAQRRRSVRCASFSPNPKSSAYRLHGGRALNAAMVSALGRELRERLIVPRDPRITGALGAALLARNGASPGG